MTIFLMLFGKVSWFFHQHAHPDLSSFRVTSSCGCISNTANIPDLLWHPIYPISQAADGSTVLNIRHLSRECGDNTYSRLPFSFTALFFEFVFLYSSGMKWMNNLQPFSIKVFTSFSALQILIKFLMTLNTKSKCLNRTKTTLRGN